jgi:hypothetical protein
LIATAGLVWAGCGTRENNGLGVGLIEEQAVTKAVRVAALTPPDTSADFQLDSPQGTAGQSPSLLIGRESGLLSRALLRFELGPLPDSGQGAVLDTAFVRLSFDEGFGNLSSLTVSVHRVTRSWTEGIVSADTLFPAIDPPISTVALPVAVEGDSAFVPITDLVRFWIDRPDSNFGIALVPDDATSALLEFFSGESASPPRLEASWVQNGSDSTAAVLAGDDTHFTSTLPGYVPLDEEPGRLTVARGIPARSLMKFALPDLGPRATVNRAELTLWADQPLSRLTEFTIGAQRVTAEPWREDSTSIDTFFEGTIAVNASTDSTNVEVTTLVAGMVEYGNHGFLVRAAS